MQTQSLTSCSESAWGGLSAGVSRRLGAAARAENSARRAVCPAQLPAPSRTQIPVLFLHLLTFHWTNTGLPTACCPGSGQASRVTASGAADSHSRMMGNDMEKGHLRSLRDLCGAGKGTPASLHWLWPFSPEGWYTSNEFSSQRDPGPGVSRLVWPWGAPNHHTHAPPPPTPAYAPSQGNTEKVALSPRWDPWISPAFGARSPD